MGRKKRNKVVFDKEIVTKEVAEKIVAEHRITEFANEELQEKNAENGSIAETQSPSRKRRSKKKADSDAAKSKKKNKRKETRSAAQTEPSKKRKREEASAEQEVDSTQPEDELNPEKPEVKREESIRAKKRKKHAELMQEKKVKTELALQEKCLNYLSQWKHNREEWKFEKLKQVWLQQNMFNIAKVPEESWEVLVEYFCGSQGKARDVIVKDALKIIEADDEENIDENWDVKMNRARDIVQNLQE